MRFAFGIENKLHKSYGTNLENESESNKLATKAFLSHSFQKDRPC